MAPLYKKIIFDANYRMDSTLNILRACRILNYKFFASTPLNALIEEIEQLQRIRSCITVMQKMRDELVSYKLLTYLELNPYGSLYQI